MLPHPLCPPNTAVLRRKRTRLDSASLVRVASSGEGGIRTPGTRKGTLDFESSAFDHSATSPGTAIQFLAAVSFAHGKTPSARWRTLLRARRLRPRCDG